MPHCNWRVAAKVTTGLFAFVLTRAWKGTCSLPCMIEGTKTEQKNGNKAVISILKVITTKHI